MRSQTISEPVSIFSSLRKAMRSNSIFSEISGLVLLVGAKPVSSFMGLSQPAVLAALGAVLLLYGILLFWASSQQVIKRSLGYTAVIMDVGWVIGSVAILVSGWPALTVAGSWMIALLAEVVALFAVWQAYALRKQRHS